MFFIYGYGSIPINTIFRGIFTSINPSYFDVFTTGVLLVLTHIAMENGRFIDGLPIENGWIFHGYVK